MISESDINNYRQIKAPQMLKESVLKTAAGSRKKAFINAKTLSALAACFLILLVGAFVIKSPGGELQISVVDYAAASYSSRSLESVTVVFEGEGKISVEPESEGFYYSADGEIASLENKKRVNNRLEVVWSISEEPGYLKVNGTLYEISFSTEPGKVSVEKIEK